MSNATIRYRIINSMLVNKETVSIDEIIEACNDFFGFEISERTIRDDIKAMRENRMLGWYAPIENVRPRKYRYSDRDYSVDRLKLTNEEAEALNFMGKLLDQYKNMVPFKQIPGVIQRIFNHVRIKKELLQDEFGDFIDFEKAPETPGLEYIVPLIEHIRKKQVIKITYQKFNSDGLNYFFPFHPYLLKEYRNRWYVFGYHEYFEGMRIYGLDRIKSIERIPGHEYVSSEIPPRDYFNNVIGVTKFSGTEPQKVLIKCSRQQAPYILSQPLHESQELIEDEEDYIIISLEVHDSPELQMTLYSMHTQVEVLAPKEMREYFRRVAKDLYATYSK